MVTALVPLLRRFRAGLLVMLTVMVTVGSGVLSASPASAAGQVSVYPTAVDFGTAPVGGSVTANVQLTAPASPDSAYVNSISMLGTDSPFHITQDGCTHVYGWSLCGFTISFQPAAASSYTGTAHIAYTSYFFGAQTFDLPVGGAATTGRQVHFGTSTGAWQDPGNPQPIGPGVIVTQRLTVPVTGGLISVTPRGYLPAGTTGVLTDAVTVGVFDDLPGYGTQLASVTLHAGDFPVGNTSGLRIPLPTAIPVQAGQHLYVQMTRPGGYMYWSRTAQSREPMYANGQLSNIINPAAIDADLLTPLIDTAPPMVSVSGPSARVHSASATVSWTGTDPDDAASALTYSCSVDGATATSCTSPLTLNGLTDSAHHVTVIGSDPAGNDSAAQSLSWTVDTSTPTLAVTTQPAPAVRSTQATIGWIASDTDDPSGSLSFTCTIDASPAATCSSPLVVTGLRQGKHTVTITGADPAGNRSVVQNVGWIVDTTAPSVTITTRPAAKTTSTTAKITWTGTDPGRMPAAIYYRCIIDGHPAASCAAPLSLIRLRPGKHTVSVTAEDDAGNTSRAVSVTWNVLAGGARPIWGAPAGTNQPPAKWGAPSAHGGGLW